MMGKEISVQMFGKDHWSLLAYIEHCCVNSHDGVGTIDRRRMRCNASTHPMLTGPYSTDIPWKLSYSTRLAGFFDFADRGDPAKAIAAGLQLRDHDDWDCLEGLEAAGFIDVLSLVNGFVKMTPHGSGVAAKLRAHKTAGGHFAEFSPSPAPTGVALECNTI